MSWQKTVGRILTAAVAVAMAVFAILGETPTWWAAVLALAVPVVNALIGSWKPPE